jgi:hypothetical protein
MYLGQSPCPCRRLHDASIGRVKKIAVIAGLIFLVENGGRAAETHLVGALVLTSPGEIPHAQLMTKLSRIGLEGPHRSGNFHFAKLGIDQVSQRLYSGLDAKGHIGTVR